MNSNRQETELSGYDIVNLSISQRLKQAAEPDDTLQTTPDLWAAQTSPDDYWAVPPPPAEGQLIGGSRTRSLISFFNPEELRDYVPSIDEVLVGDCHIMRGEVFVIGGEPGVGKSRGAIWLAVCGATGRDWFGLKVHRRFRTMIIQSENGRYRLRLEFLGFPCEVLRDWIRVSEPPPFGLALGDPAFIEDIKAAIEEFKPDVVILDPWNAAAKDDKQRDYAETFDRLLALLPKGPDKPALGIVAHTRKPQVNEKRTGGTGLMHILSGSHMLSSVPRAVFIMTRACEDETDDRIVFFNPKNNNGHNAARSAWHRTDHGFTPAGDFDWEAFEKSAGDSTHEKQKVTLDHLRQLFTESESEWMELGDAVDRLVIMAGVSRPTVYGALGEKGRFAEILARNGKLISLKE